MKTALLSAVIAIVLLTSAVGVQAAGRVSSWEVSVDFVPPDQEHIQIFLNMKNTGTEDITGLEISLDADSLEYLEEEKLSFDDEGDSATLQVAVQQDGGKSTITIKLPSPLEPAQSERLLLNFNSQGLLKKEGSQYRATVQFTSPKFIMAGGNAAPADFDFGSFRVHTPEGFIYTKHDPAPWRMIWQGVSGFNAHFVLIFNGGTPIDQKITASFRESATIKRAVELYKDLKVQERSGARSKDDLDNANHHITNGANYVVTGNEGLAGIELDEAESYLSGRPLEEIISDEFNIDEGDGVETNQSINPGYVLGALVLALFLVLLVFGKNIVSVLKGGKKDEE